MGLVCTISYLCCKLNMRIIATGMGQEPMTISCANIEVGNSKRPCSCGKNVQAKYWQYNQLGFKLELVKSKPFTKNLHQFSIIKEGNWLGERFPHYLRYFMVHINISHNRLAWLPLDLVAIGLGEIGSEWAVRYGKCTNRFVVDKWKISWLGQEMVWIWVVYIYIPFQPIHYYTTANRTYSKAGSA